MTHFEMLAIALILDALLGEPDWLWGRVPHPVKLIGQGIDWLDQRMNRHDFRRVAGVVMIAGLFIAAVLVGGIIAWLPDYGVLELIGCAILLSFKSLIEHVRAVALALPAGLDAARAEVAKIVGRDVGELDENGVARAAIESGAEGFCDGLVAPAFWFLVFGLPGILAYKVVNTADSMVGHLNEKYAEFGWGTAWADDILNFIPARIAALIIVATGLKKEPFEVMVEDADMHRSMNAGWPEAAMAGVLDIALAGPRSYDGEFVKEPFINSRGRRDLTAQDIHNSIAVLWKGWAGLLVFVTIFALLF
jgi:adenosylcobinamide-phosphate synthase